jgi:hypothetical protein
MYANLADLTALLEKHIAAIPALNREGDELKEHNGMHLCCRTRFRPVGLSATSDRLKSFLNASAGLEVAANLP